MKENEILTNKFGTKMKVIKYRNTNDIDVEFLDEHHFIKEHTTYSNFKKLTVKNPYDRSVFGVGFLGEGKYLSRINGWTTDIYQCWRNIVERCYLEERKEEHPSYFGNNEMCSEWLNFQNFAEWYTNNAYDIGKERLHLDKDIKYKGNLVYSPHHCILVPQSINEQYKENSGRKRSKDNDLPYTIRRKKEKYNVSYRGENLGTYETIDECVYEYKTARKIYITELVNKYENMPKEIKEIILQSL